MRAALTWIIALFKSKGEVLVKRVPVVELLGPARVRIYVDASPWGGGAVLHTRQRPAG